MVRAKKDGDQEAGRTEMDQNKEGKEHETGREKRRRDIKNNCARSGGGSWPGGAGAQDLAHAARPGPAPSVVQLLHSGPYHEVSPTLGLWENKWCPR